LHSVFLQSLYIYFINRNHVLLYFSVSGNIYVYFIVISLLSFRSENNLEHRNVIREIEPELFLKDEERPQFQHSKLMNFEEEMRFMEECLAKDTRNEDCKKV
jgi:hypothetical protein